ncbi:MAG: beta-N-acetylglucosaminidase domain-containing protein [Bacteroidaceae bacterium]|nr:beta-N-acetylglucosaminidase domain-containing protein [Bacteroidaceae bacterium]
MKKLFTLTLWCCLLTISAQTYTIYPVPQSITPQSGTVAFTTDVNVVCESGIDQATKNRLEGILGEHGLTCTYSAGIKANASNILLGIGGSNGAADNQATSIGLDRSALTQSGKYDRHIIRLWKSGEYARLLVLGENTDAVFFGLASVEQMMDQYAPEAMPAVTINDWADLQSRGLVEGYYGYPYSISVKKDLMRFMMRYKMNTYLYGAKSDPYHSEQWTAPYPTSITAKQEENGWLSQAMVREITQQSAATKVNFIWAIHPGNNFINSSTVVNDILGKFDKMYNLGVRQFAVFVDDVGLPNSSQYQLNADRLTAVQRGLEAKYNVAGAAPEDTVRPVHFVPQIYATSWVGASEREGFYTALASTQKNVVVYTTGWGVWSIPNSSDLNVVRQYLGRDVAWWWNYPCNDNADGQIYTKDMYANFFEMPAVNSNGTVPSSLTGGIGIVSNPMQEGELSKVALFSVADYSWHTNAFNNAQSYEAAVKAVVGNDDAEDFKLLSDYLRWNDPTDFGNLLNSVKTRITSASNNYSKQLRERMELLQALCTKFVAYKESPRESDRLLYHDIAPWLLKLQTMTAITLRMMDAAQSTASLDERWPDYVAALEQIASLETNTDYTAYALEGMGSGISVSSRQSQASHKFFYPFMSWLKGNILSTAFSTAGQKQMPIQNLGNESSTKLKAHYSSSTAAYYLSGTSMVVPAGKFIGISLPQAIRVGTLTIDETLRSQYEVRYSEDFRTWTTLENDGSLPQGFVKYIIFVNTDSESKTTTMSSRMFSVTAETLPTISSVSVPSGDNAEDQPLANLTDGNYTTWWAVKKNQANGDTYMLNLAKSTTIHDVRICFGTKNGDYANGARVEVSANGSSWTALKVKGTSTTTFSLDASYAIESGSEMKYIDFDGAETTAKYVRLRVTNANTAKWLRLFEMEVNKQSISSPRCVDGNGNALAQAVDATANTSASPSTNSIVYRFVQPNPTTALTIYSGSQTPGGVSIDITADGQTWTHLANLSQCVQTVDLTEHPDAYALRLSWNTVAPVVYEIAEQTDETSLLPTSLRQVLTTSASNSANFYDLQGRPVAQPLSGGIYIHNGRKVIY